MPEINFKIEWSDGMEEICYSPSLVVKKYFTPGVEYELAEFVNLSDTALKVASDRVKAAYGFPCDKALGQLHRIKLKAAEYVEMDSPKVRFIEFVE